MSKNYKKSNKKGKKTTVKRDMQRLTSINLVLNVVCAAILVVAILMYLCDFFQLNIDGDIQNRVNGFRFSFILSSDMLKDSDNVLSLINKKHAGKIAFAAVSSCLVLFSLIAFVGLFIYRAATKKTLLSYSVLVCMGLFFVLCIVQISACSALTSIVTSQYYADCVTCTAQTLSFLPLIIFLPFIVFYFALSLWLYRSYGVSFANK